MNLISPSAELTKAALKTMHYAKSHAIKRRDRPREEGDYQRVKRCLEALRSQPQARNIEIIEQLTYGVKFYKELRRSHGNEDTAIDMCFEDYCNDVPNRFKKKEVVTAANFLCLAAQIAFMGEHQGSTYLRPEEKWNPLHAEADDLGYEYLADTLRHNLMFSDSSVPIAKGRQLS